MGYICPYCGEGLPQDEECPSQVIDDVLDDLRPSRAAKREQDRRRRILIRAAGPVESITATEIGERDDWVCGICQDTVRLVDARPDAPRALSPSIDHIIPVSRGGTHTRGSRICGATWKETAASLRLRSTYVPSCRGSWMVRRSRRSSTGVAFPRGGGLPARESST